MSRTRTNSQEFQTKGLASALVRKGFEAGSRQSDERSSSESSLFRVPPMGLSFQCCIVPSEWKRHIHYIRLNERGLKVGCWEIDEKYQCKNGKGWKQCLTGYFNHRMNAFPLLFQWKNHPYYNSRGPFLMQFQRSEIRIVGGGKYSDFRVKSMNTEDWWLLEYKVLGRLLSRILLPQ